MLARARASLSYANVVATLALFIALGGSAYAAHLITSKDVKNRSLKGGDLRLDTITGKEINESKLSTVPAARQAQNAGTADVARSAGTATTAGSANTANVANVAQDAQALAGQGAGAFEKSTRVQFGRAPANPAGTPDEKVLFSWPELGVEVRTSTDQCGGGSPVTSFALRNTKSAGGGDLEFTNGLNTSGTVAPGAVERRCSVGDSSVDARVSDATRSLFVDCINAAGELRCVGIRSEP